MSDLHYRVDQIMRYLKQKFIFCIIIFNRIVYGKNITKSKIRFLHHKFDLNCNFTRKCLINLFLIGLLHGKLWKNVIIILKMNFKKRKQLKELICGKKEEKYAKTLQRSKTKINQNYSSQQILDFGYLKLFKGLFSFDNLSKVNKFSQFVYKEINYAVNSIEKPPLELIRPKQIKIQRKNLRILFLDLDNTLIYCNSSIKNPNIELYHSNQIYKINFRPHCFNFLKNMSKIFDIYIYTASTYAYAKPIIQYLNQDHQTISGILHRQQCLKTKNGLYIKDLRIVEDISLEDIVIVDNYIHSFSFNLQNGIPIQQYKQNKNDRILYQLEKILMQANKSASIQQYLRQKFKLKEIIRQPYERFCEKLRKQYLTENILNRNFLTE